MLVIELLNQWRDTANEEQSRPRPFHIAGGSLRVVKNATTEVLLTEIHESLEFFTLGDALRCERPTLRWKESEANRFLPDEDPLLLQTRQDLSRNKSFRRSFLASFPETGARHLEAVGEQPCGKLLDGYSFSRRIQRRTQRMYVQDDAKRMRWCADLVTTDADGEHMVGSGRAQEALSLDERESKNPANHKFLQGNFDRPGICSLRAPQQDKRFWRRHSPEVIRQCIVHLTLLPSTRRLRLVSSALIDVSAERRCP